MDRRRGGRVYVRSAYGADNPWFRRALASGRGHIRAGGVERDVEFDHLAAGDPVHADVDTAYHAEHDRYGPDIGVSDEIEYVSRETANTWEHVEVSQPEAGTWTVELFGVDVTAAGEPVTLSVYQADKPNESPVGKIAARVDGNDWVLDTSSSTDPDGQVIALDWYLSTAQEDVVKQGATIRIPRIGATERTVTLVVTDDRGATDFVELRLIPVDVKPGSDDNPIQLKSTGVTPVALLSTSTFDARAVSPSTVRVGPGNAVPQEKTAKAQDVNGDGRPDQVLHIVTQQLKLRFPRLPDTTCVCRACCVRLHRLLRPPSRRNR